ncbi:MAG: hypothetical protein ACI3Z0_09275 [Candidatus Cryptobacteroides sp.]
MAMFIAMAMTLLDIASCSKDKPGKGGTDNLAGDWQLVDVDFGTKSAVIGEQTVTVYLRLMDDGKFELWQQLGQGRYQKFSGSWSCRKGILRGKYSDGNDWGSEYEVSIEGDFLTMTALPDRVDVYSYSRCTIPDSLR